VTVVVVEKFLTLVNGNLDHVQGILLMLYFCIVYVLKILTMEVGLSFMQTNRKFCYCTYV